MEKPHFKYSKDLIYESKNNEYICRYIFDGNIIDFKIKNDSQAHKNIVAYWRKIDDKIKLDFIKHVHFLLMPVVKN
jgi:hypothetical protein